MDRPITAVGQAARLAVILGASLTLTVIAVLASPPPIAQVGRTDLHITWITSLAAMLQQGQVSGRDFIYTYGPLSQALAGLAALFTASGSALDAYPSILLAFRLAGIALLAVILAVIKSVTAWYAAFIYAVVLLLNWFSPNGPVALLFAFRSLFLLACGIMLGLAATRRTLRSRNALSVATGLLAVIAQLITVELGMYAVISSALFLASLAVIAQLTTHQARSKPPAPVLETAPKLPNPEDRVRELGPLWPPKAYAQMLLAVVATYALGNLILSALFKLTAPGYTGLFDYQAYALELMRGYANTMGFPWALGWAPTLVLFGLVAFNIAFAARNWRVMSMSRDSLILLSLVAFSLPPVKQAMSRSDLGHILAGFLPTMLVFLVIGAPGLHSRLSRWAWAALLIAVIAAWPIAGLSGIQILTDWIQGRLSLGVTLSELALAPSPLRFAVGATLPTGDGPMLNFPAENTIGIAAGRRLIAPITLGHNAHTPLLQQKYVRELERFAGDLEVTYGLDQVASPAIDRVQHISRAPIVFDYLLSHYELKSPQPVLPGVYALKPRSQPAGAEGIPLDFEVTAGVGPDQSIRLKRSAPCSLVRLAISMDYPLLASLGRPNGLWATFSQDGRVVHESGLVPIETNRPFTTFISLTAPDRFYEVFDQGNAPGPAWDTLTLKPRPTGFLGVDPAGIRIRALECIRP